MNRVERLLAVFAFDDKADVTFARTLCNGQNIDLGVAKAAEQPARDAGAPAHVLANHRYDFQARQKLAVLKFLLPVLRGKLSTQGRQGRLRLGFAANNTDGVFRTGLADHDHVDLDPGKGPRTRGWQSRESQSCRYPQC